MRCPACGTQIVPFKNPAPTVDIIIETEGGIVLIERKNPPFGWALPGGFVDYGESFEDAARREAAEETSLTVTLTLQFHTYSAPDRDARQHTASTVYIATASGQPVAADDAQRAEVFYQDNLPPLVFDHERILRDYFAFKQSGNRPRL
ncbi:MAG: NUDIX hydrolase [Desulfobulbus sp.]|nr:NUDIX hydrolase [Desulfobulbus sp.]